MQWFEGTVCESSQVVLVGACSSLGLASFLPYLNDIVVLTDTATYHHTGFSCWFLAALSHTWVNVAFHFSLLTLFMTFGEVWLFLFVSIMTFFVGEVWLFLFFYYDIFHGILLTFSTSLVEPKYIIVAFL